MSTTSISHETIAWAKQRLEEADLMISKVEQYAASVKASARKEADDAIAALQNARMKLAARADELTTQTVAARGKVEDTVKALERDWVETETAFQKFLATTTEQAIIVRDTITARADVQRKAWSAYFESLRAETAKALETARGDFDAAARRLSVETDKLQEKIGKATGAGDESWKAVKSGFQEMKAIHDKTISKVSEAISKAF